MRAYQDSGQPPERRAADLLKDLTLSEKVGQINQRFYGFNSYEVRGEDVTVTDELREEVRRWGGLGVLYGLLRADPWTKRDEKNGLRNGTLAKKAYNTVQRYVIEHSRHGIPVLMSTEAPHGLHALGGYLLPVNLAMGASFDPELVGEAFFAVGRQMRALGVHLALLSTLDVLRDPRWGRSEECYGEDPLLCARMGAAAVKAVRAQGVGVVVKHFAAQGETTGGINASAARVGARELREIHLPPAGACVAAGAEGVMAAYNEIDGVPCHANPGLLDGILRGELGFDGFVMADGTAVDRLGILTGDTVKSGALALCSGVDVSLWDDGFTLLETAVKTGFADEADIDRAALRVLTLKFRMGLFDNPYLDETEEDARPVSDASLRLARASVVLLKNEGVLPLARGKTYAVIGPHADDRYRMLGDYTPPMRAEDCVTPLDGVRRLLGEAGLVRYAKGCGFRDGTEDEMNEALAVARASDVILFFCGGSSSRFVPARFDGNGAVIADDESDMDCGEGVDCASLRLPEAQLRLLEALRALGKPIVTVVMQGRPYAIEEFLSLSDALCAAFYPGPAGGQALAEILWGETPPGGRLPVSIPRSASVLPVYYNHKASYDAMAYCDEKDARLFPFGFGLGYETALFSGFRLSKKSVEAAEAEGGGAPEVAFRVKNPGTKPLRAVPMLFLRRLTSSVTPRVKELADFLSVALEPGDERDVRFRLSSEALSVWNPELRFAVESGTLRLSVEEGGQEYWNEIIEIV